MKRKIVLLGAGSGYFEYVIAELALTPELAGCTLMLHDIDAKRMALMKQVGRRIIAKTAAKLALRSTTQLSRALDGADVAISSIGVHGPNARWHKLDCDVCARFGIIHTTGDTVGPAGLSQGLRIIPIYIKIAQAMKKYCPDVILLNHSNPMGPICRAVTKFAGINVIGFCHNVANDIKWFGKVLNVPSEELEVTIVGPNHACWLVAICHQGCDVYPELKRRILRQRPEFKHRFGREVLKLLDIFPVGGDRHIIEFFPHARVATHPSELRYGLRWRSEGIAKALPAKEIADKPTELELRAKGLAALRIPEKPTPESMGQQLRSVALGQEHIHFVNTPNRGAVPNLPDWAVLELKALVGSHGARPIYVGDLPPQAARWSLAQVYAHELTVDAAAEGSRAKALQALASDPMMLHFGEVEKVFDALVKAQGPRLARFRKRIR